MYIGIENIESLIRFIWIYNLKNVVNVTSVTGDTILCSQRASANKRELGHKCDSSIGAVGVMHPFHYYGTKKISQLIHRPLHSYIFDYICNNYCFPLSNQYIVYNLIAAINCFIQYKKLRA